MPRRQLLLRVLTDCAGGAHALPERSFRLLLRRNGLPMPDQQVPRLDTDGRRRYLDAAWRRYRLRVEIDGAAHREVRQWWADLERTNALVLLDDGYRELRFPAALIESRPARVVAVVEAGLWLGGWRR